MPDASPPEGITTLDESDHLLLGAAFAAKCDAICTYNVKDFPDGHIVVRTPLAIHRWIAVPQLEHYVQAVLLSDRGTLLFFGRLHHESSIGPILESGGSVTVVANEKGFYQTQGRRSQEM